MLTINNYISIYFRLYPKTFQYHYNNLTPPAYVYDTEGWSQYFPQILHGVHQLYLCPALFDMPKCPSKNISNYNITSYVGYKYQSVIDVMVHELAHIVEHTKDSYQLSFYNERAQQCAAASNAHLHIVDGEIKIIDDRSVIVSGSLDYSTSWHFIFNAYMLDTHCID